MMARITELLKALANPGRRRVYQVICRASHRRRGRGITVEAICRITGLKQPAVSHHIARLASVGLIERKRRRYWVLCTPSKEGLVPLRRFVRDPAGYPVE
ncbi:MAG: winged helix-turn-helix transcriptional regulator [Planctomycetes bacterium]|nr:winged helix-turn-helix transcriptional regulator [Planctomycetota bacterium]